MVEGDGETCRFWPGEMMMVVLLLLVEDGVKAVSNFPFRSRRRILESSCRSRVRIMEDQVAEERTKIAT